MGCRCTGHLVECEIAYIITEYFANFSFRRRLFCRLVSFVSSVHWNSNKNDNAETFQSVHHYENMLGTYVIV